MRTVSLGGPLSLGSQVELAESSGLTGHPWAQDWRTGEEGVVVGTEGAGWDGGGVGVPPQPWLALRSGGGASATLAPRAPSARLCCLPLD